jgi:hypothetical protein
MTKTPGRLTLAALVAAIGFGAARADLITSPDLADGVAALPRLTAPSPAAARINADFAAPDADAAKFGADCNTDPPRSLHERFTTVTFAGPAYLSLLDRTSFNCPGAAHPNYVAAPLTYDLASGDEVDWQALFPSVLLARGSQPQPDAVKASPTLVALYFAHATAMDAECRGELVRFPPSFAVWRDADEGAMVLMQASHPRVMRSCADAVTLPLTIQRAQNFNSWPSGHAG